MKQIGLVVCAALIVLTLGARPLEAKGSIDVEAAQALLDVQSLDGWLLYQNKGKNSVAEALIGPERARRAWFYWVPANGKPVALVHRSDLGAFTDVAGDKVSYTATSQIKGRLQKMLGEAKSVAMEYSPDSGIDSLTRVDARTAALVTSLGVKVTSSAELVQFTKSAWGIGGRVSHYVAAHHLHKLTQEAIAFISVKISAGEMVTEYDVQQHILAGYKIRGLSGTAPLVASGVSSADPSYTPTARSARIIKSGDIVQFELTGHVPTDARPIVANISWVAYVGNDVPDRVRKRFSALVKARNAVINLLRTRMAQRQPVAGFEADRAARESMASAGLADSFTHRTGHSLDTAVDGDGAHLDDLQAKDTRKLVVGSGFTVGPGVYFAEEYGMRTEVDVFLAANGVELTSPAQKTVSMIRIGKP